MNNEGLYIMSKYDYEDNPQGLSSNENEQNVNYQYIYNYIDKCGHQREKLRILEVGTGGARNLLALHRRYSKKIELFGTDISASALKYASALKIGTFRQSSADLIPFEEKFDLILMIDILEHLDSKDVVIRTLNNAQRYLSKGVCIYISVPIELNRFSLTWSFSKLFFLKNLTKIYFGHLIQFNTKSFSGLIDTNRFEISECFYSVHFFSQIQMLLFFYCPKILLDFFLGKRQAHNLRDSNEILNEGGKGLLSILKKSLIAVTVPFAKLGFKESCMRKNSSFAAGNLHLVLTSKFVE